MSELKAYQVDAFIKKNPISFGVYLIYGSDMGLVHERSLELCNTQNSTTPDNLITLDMSEIDADPSKLARQALTPSLFGDTPVIRVRNANKSLVPILQELFSTEFQAIIILEAASLTKRDKLRVIVEQASNGWTLPSFADDNKSLNMLINQVFTQNDIMIDSDAVQVLMSVLGNDREITRRELEKLVNFAKDTKTISAEDILALCGDNSMIALDKLIDALGMGQLSLLETALNRSYSAGIDSQALLAASARHFHFLRTVRSKIDAGANSNSALGSTFPKPHFSRKNNVNTQVSRWTNTGLIQASKRIFEATFETRRNAILSETITRRTLLGICIAAARQ